jgi:serine/threonine protein kinase
MKSIFVKSILFQFLFALDYFHKRSIAHCDITPSKSINSELDRTLPGVVKLMEQLKTIKVSRAFSSS